MPPDAVIARLSMFESFLGQLDTADPSKISMSQGRADWADAPGDGGQSPQIISSSSRSKVRQPDQPEPRLIRRKAADLLLSYPPLLGAATEKVGQTERGLDLDLDLCVQQPNNHVSKGQLYYLHCFDSPRKYCHLPQLSYKFGWLLDLSRSSPSWASELRGMSPKALGRCLSCSRY